MNIIAADVGGTKTHLVYVNAERPDIILYEAKYQCKDYDNFEVLLSTFIQDSCLVDETLDVLSLAVPGVIKKGVARLTNLPWTIDRHNLIKEFSVDQVYMTNDFQAAALGTLELNDEDCIVLNKAKRKPGAVRVVAGAGTGLGVSWMQGAGSDLHVHSTEGGHIDFAPVDSEQLRLLQFLINKYGHVSYERLLSGHGLVNLYAFLSGSDPNKKSARWINEEASQGNAIAQEAIRLFVRIYGAYLGNLALLFKPEAGIYITGGMAAKLIHWMQSEHFLDAYLFKGRMRHVAQRVPVYLVCNESVGVMGALSKAIRRLQEEIL